MPNSIHWKDQWSYLALKTYALQTFGLPSLLSSVLTLSLLKCCILYIIHKAAGCVPASTIQHLELLWHGWPESLHQYPSLLRLLGVRAKSNQCSVHRLPQSLTWTALLLVLLVPSASWWGHCAILIVMKGATGLPLPYSLWLPACFGLTHPSGPEACQRGFSPPVNMQLFTVHPFTFPVSFGGPGHFICAFLSNMTVVSYCSVHCVERLIIYFNITRSSHWLASNHLQTAPTALGLYRAWTIPRKLLW